MAVYTMGILYLIPFSIMMINYGLMTFTLIKSLKISSQLKEYGKIR